MRFALLRSAVKPDQRIPGKKEGITGYDGVLPGSSVGCFPGDDFAFTLKYEIDLLRIRMPVGIIGTTGIKIYDVQAVYLVS